MNLRKLNEGTPRETWEIDATGQCGMYSFNKVVTVVDPLSENPGVSIRGPFYGLRGVKKAIALIEQERAKFGLTTLE